MLKKLGKKLKSLVVNQEGQGMAEYGLILVGVVIVVIVVVKALGSRLTNVFNQINNAL